MTKREQDEECARSHDQEETLRELRDEEDKKRGVVYGPHGPYVLSKSNYNPYAEDDDLDNGDNGLTVEEDERDKYD